MASVIADGSSSQRLSPWTVRERMGELLPTAFIFRDVDLRSRRRGSGSGSRCEAALMLSRDAAGFDAERFRKKRPVTIARASPTPPTPDTAGHRSGSGSQAGGLTPADNSGLSAISAPLRARCVDFMTGLQFGEGDERGQRCQSARRARQLTNAAQAEGHNQERQAGLGG